MEEHANSHEEAPEDSLDVEPPSVHDGRAEQTNVDECRRAQTSAECRMQNADSTDKQHESATKTSHPSRELKRRENSRHGERPSCSSPG